MPNHAMTVLWPEEERGRGPRRDAMDSEGEAHGGDGDGRLGEGGVVEEQAKSGLGEQQRAYLGGQIAGIPHVRLAGEKA